MSPIHVSHARQSTGLISQSTGPPMNIFIWGRAMCQLDIFHLWIGGVKDKEKEMPGRKHVYKKRAENDFLSRAFSHVWNLIRGSVESGLWKVL